MARLRKHGLWNTGSVSGMNTACTHFLIVPETFPEGNGLEWVLGKKDQRKFCSLQSGIKAGLRVASAPQSNRGCRSPDPLHQISRSVFILVTHFWTFRATDSEVLILDFLLNVILFDLETCFLNFKWFTSSFFERDGGCIPACTQSCPTLRDRMNCSPPGPSVHGIIPTRILEWVAIFFSRRASWPRDRTHVSCICRQILYHWATWEVLSWGWACINI